MNGGPQDIRSRPRARRPAGSSAIHGAGGGGGGPSFTLQAPTTERPPGARDFNTFGTLAGLTAASGLTVFPTAAFQIPAGNVGVVRSFLLLVNGLLVSSDVRFDLLYDTSPVDGWNRLTINPRAAASVEISWTPEETYIPVPEQATVGWRAQVLDAGTYQVSVAMHGWYYATALDAEMRRLWGAG